MIPAVLLAYQNPVGKPAHPVHRAVISTSADDHPVTMREARQALSRVTTLFQKASGFDFGMTSLPDSDRPLSRDEVVGEMDRIYRFSSPRLRFTPTPTRHDASLFRIDPAEIPSLERLVSLGCIAKIGPLAIGPSPTLTPREFGDALGLFMARMAQMGHMPSPKWTPMLKED